ncbi:MAG: DnaT-like ssDNA-binding protein [Verrucomicrobiota bacterium]
MALTLTKEDGTGKYDSNSYADVADGDAYHEGHLYGTAWTGATEEQKAVALVMATRLIDVEFQFNGGRVKTEQALQWPRAECPDPDRVTARVAPLRWIRDDYLAFDRVPKAVVDAACELARELLVMDRTAAPPGEGVLKQHNADFSETTYSKTDTRQIIPALVRTMLGKYGALLSGGSGAVRLVRV